jgi:hypothetical protein
MQRRTADLKFLLLPTASDLARRATGFARKYRMLGHLALAAASFFAVGNAAQAAFLTDAPLDGNPEIQAPPPPAFSMDHLIDIEMPAITSIRLGVDPATIKLGSDGVVRYVAVMRSTIGSAVSANYAAIRCATGEYKLYARHYAKGDWRPVANPDWVPLSPDSASRYALRIARAGACRDASSNTSTAQILKDLRGGPLYYRSP